MHIERRVASIILGLSLVLVGACNKKDAGGSSASGAATSGGGDKVASCNTPAEFTCVQYSNATIEAAGEDSLKKVCAGKAGTYATAACATAKQVSKCASPEGDKYDYEGSPAPVTDASCTGIGGKFTKLGAKG